MAQARTWILTINNPEQNDGAFNEYCKSLEHVKYFIFQRERGEQGTEHFQLYIEFSIGKRFETVKGYFPKAHIEKRNGTKTQARDYCSKRDTRAGDVYEYGKFVEERTRTDITDFLELVNTGADNMTLQKLYPALYTQFGVDKIERFRQDKLQHEYGGKMRDIKTTYVYGKTRLGKTTYVYDLHNLKDVCRVTNYKVGVFENYRAQKVLLLDEYIGQFDITFLNNLLDRLPIDLPARFANRTACFDTVYIVSNLPIAELYKDEQTKTPEVYRAFLERVHDVICFVSVGKWAYEKRGGMVVLTPEQSGGLPW